MSLLFQRHQQQTEQFCVVITLWTFVREVSDSILDRDNSSSNTLRSVPRYFKENFEITPWFCHYSLTSLPSNRMEQDRSWKASSSSVGQEVAHILWNYTVQNRPQPLPIMYYMNALSLQSCVFKTHFNIVPSASTSTKRFILQVFHQ